MELLKQRKEKKMGRISFLSEVPEEVIYDLNQRIIEANYGDAQKLADWFKSQGYKTSKTAMHRYIKELKAINGHSGTSGSFKLYASLTASESNLDMLYKELGRLEYRKQEILNRIREITEQ